MRQDIDTETAKKEGKVKENEFDEQLKQIKELEEEIGSLEKEEAEKAKEEGQSNLKMYNHQMEQLEQEQ